MGTYVTNPNGVFNGSESGRTAPASRESAQTQESSLSLFLEAVNKVEESELIQSSNPVSRGTQGTLPPSRGSVHFAGIAAEVYISLILTLHGSLSLVLALTLTPTPTLTLTHDWRKRKLSKRR